jgi:ATP-binding cassette subfamily F protein 3
MPILTASNLAQSYGAEDIFEGISLAVPHQAKIALVGPNGSGKTTLLRLLAGLEEPTSGAVHRARRSSVAYLPQQADVFFDQHPGTLWEAMLEVFADLQEQAAELRRLEAAMEDPATRERAARRYGEAQEAFERAGGYAYEYRIEQVLAGVGFDHAAFEQPVTQLSGGQKTRALLARLLLEEPDLLLLDEPTNHLDLSGIEWLEDYLASWKSALVVVAHDRAFLDAVVEQVWELQWGRLEQYRGNYSAYVDQKAERVARQQAEYEKQQASIAQTEEFIRRNIAGQRSNEAKGRRKRLARLERIERPQEYCPPSIALGEVSRSGDLVLGLYDLAVGYEPDAPLFTVEERELRRGQRVALLGPNGSGKSTLVRTILGERQPLDGRVRIGASVEIGYFAQGHSNLAPEKTVLETIRQASRMTTTEARSFLGRYRFSGDDVFKCVRELSGGEQARVALAVLVLQGANVLILDEPTNHLDIPSQEVLEDILADFEGTLLMVTHDRYLIRRLADCVWAIEDGDLLAFRWGYDEYRDWLAQRRKQQQARAEAQKAERAERQKRQRASRRAEQEAARQAERRAELEQRIEALEARQAELESQLALASERQAVAEVRDLGAEYRQIEEELDALLADWLAGEGS